VMPMDNSSWPDTVDACGDERHNTPLSATALGLDGRTTKGHVDDYWVCYGSTDPDPFYGNWTEHGYADCTADYMYTNQTSNYGISDGSTQFWGYSNGQPLPCSLLEAEGGDYAIDGAVGLKNFYQSRGYTVDQCYTQNIDTVASGGFSFQQYKDEIDAGRPVMIQVEGHTMVGVGYDDASNLVYLHDTWDWSVHSMTWGGSYYNMDMYAVTIVTLASAPEPPSPTPSPDSSGSIPAVLYLLNSE